VGLNPVVREGLGSARGVRRSDLQRGGSCCLHHRKHLGDDGGITQFGRVGFHDCTRVAVDRAVCSFSTGTPREA
jgi:hypothetical protein